MKSLILLAIISFNSHAQMFPKTPNEQCLKYAKKLIKHEMTIYQLRHLIESCRYNNNSLCLHESTKGLSYKDFDEVSELILLARSCQYVRPSCTRVVTKYLDLSEYNTLEKVQEINSFCQNTSYKCLDFECSQNTNRCKTFSEIKQFEIDCLR